MNEVINLLRNLKVSVDGVSERRLRAMTVARAFAYASPINVKEPFTENLDRCKGKLEDAVQDINEGILVDIKLTLDIFTSLYKARYEVATSECDPTLISYVLTQMTQADLLNNDSYEVLKLTLKDKSVSQAVSAIKQVCDTSQEDE